MKVDVTLVHFEMTQFNSDDGVVRFDKFNFKLHVEVMKFNISQSQV